MARYDFLCFILMIALCRVHSSVLQNINCRTADIVQQILRENQLNIEISSAKKHSNHLTLQEVIILDISAEQCAAVAINKKSSLVAISFVITSFGDGTGTCVVKTNQTECVTEIPDPCEPNPCKFQGTCERVGITKDRYKCHCQYPTGGKQCEDLECVKCARHNDIVFFFDDTAGSLTWQQSYERCAAKGMTMFLDKDIETHNFISNTLDRMYPDKTVQVAYWIGLRKVAGAGQPFVYNDGTILNPAYQMWLPNRPGGTECVNIANGNFYLWKWDDDPCDGVSNWKYFNLCQKRFEHLTEEILKKPGLNELFKKN